MSAPRDSGDSGESEDGSSSSGEYVSATEYLTESDSDDTTSGCLNDYRMSVIEAYENLFVGELGYVLLLQLAMRESPSANRTDVPCRALVRRVPTVTYSLEGDTFPLFTHKRMDGAIFRMIVNELLMFVNGITDTKTLEAKKCFIWKKNTTRSFLDDRGLTYKEGDMGPMYGFQWIHFGYEYPPEGFGGLPQGQAYGFNQLDSLCDMIRRVAANPGCSEGRRLLLLSYNPAAVAQSVLAPCHVLCQFFVEHCDGRTFLSSKLYQRSGDLALGVPFNVASYALLTKMIAQVCGLDGTTTFEHVIGNAHVYENHVATAELIAHRDLFRPPRLELRGGVQRLKDFTLECFKLKDYHSNDALKFEMVA